MKKLKFFVYYTFIVIIYCIFFMFNEDTSSLMKYIGYGLLAIEAVLLIIAFFYFRKTNGDNQKIRSMLDNQEYPELEKFLREKIEVETNIIRKDAYNYYLMVCLLGQDKDGEAVLLYDKISSAVYYPIIHYYKAAIEFYNGCYDNLDSLYEEFTSSYEFQKSYSTYQSFETLFKAMISFHNNDGKLDEILKDFDFDRFKIGCSVKVIEKLKTELNQKEENI